MIYNALYIALVIFLVILFLRFIGVLAGSLLYFGSPVALILIILLVLMLSRNG